MPEPDISMYTSDVTGLQKKCNTVAESSLSFLPDDLDDALIGYTVAANQSKPMACYSVLKLKVTCLEKGMGSIETYKSIERLLYAEKNLRKVAVLLNLNKDATWRTIRREKLPRWANLDTGVCGIVHTSLYGHSLAYSLPACIKILDRITSEPSSKFEGLSEVESTALQHDFLAKRILPICLYPKTPVFINFVR